jgi:hypothetical protein
MRPFENAAVARVFAAYPPEVRWKLGALRELIFATAAATEGVGTLEETLRWGEPAYVTSQTKSGSTIRIDWKPSDPGQSGGDLRALQGAGALRALGGQLDRARRSRAG